MKISSSLLAGILTPGIVHACACGCGVFDVGTSSMFPEGAGGTAFLQFDYQDQNHNWSGTSQAPDANNDDKEIKTYFTTLGFQYMFNFLATRRARLRDHISEVLALHWFG